MKRSKIYANRIRAEKQNDTSFENVPFVVKITNVSFQDLLFPLQ